MPRISPLALLLALTLATGCRPIGPPCEPSAERCNGADDDCDGQTDEEFALGTACTIGLGVCAASGAWECTESGQGVQCNVTPGTGGAESCNGLDDDCDGEVDDGLEGCCEPNSAVICGVSQGVCVRGAQTCGANRAFGDCLDASGSPVRMPGELAESCNAIDDDCDGQTDEAFGVGEACDGPGGDACADGARECTADGSAAVCNETAPDRVEACNGQDDDCDGQTDEALSGCCNPGDSVPCGATVGTCTAGSQVCSDTRTYGACVDGSGNPVRLPGQVAESCNALDDDCDGQTDETFPTLGQACDGAGADLCAQGTVVCRGDGAGVTCNETAPNKSEVCNGIDDDCDGQTDEAYPSSGEYCRMTGAACLIGEISCSAGGTTCVAPTGGARDCCGNAVDDDGDGQTDEDSFVEYCNGVDDDCDGQTDEAADLQACAPAHAVATSVCTSGACAVNTCSPGFFDTNGAYADGCEATVP